MTSCCFHRFFWTDELHAPRTAEVHRSSKNVRPFQKPRCQKNDIKKVHNLTFRRCIGVVAQNLKIPSVCLWPHLKLCYVKDKFLCNNLCRKILCNSCFNQGHHVSCNILHQLLTCQAIGDSDKWNSRVFLATLSFPPGESSSSLGLCITCGQHHVA